MKFQESVVINALPEDIFAVYARVSQWQDWDPVIESVSIDGDFEPGSRGYLKPGKAPKQKIELVAVDKNKSFSMQNKLPLCTLTFHHTIETQQSHSLVTHTVEFKGLTAQVFGRLIGSKIKPGLTDTLAGLKSYVESQVSV